MEYKGYIGKVVFDEEAGILYGKVINTIDTITFVGKSVDEVQEAFQDSVNDYLEFCAQRGEAPEEPITGKFVIQLPPELYVKAYLQAKLADKDIHRWIMDVVKDAIRRR